MPELVGERVHQPLDQVRGLGAAGAAIGVGGRRVREDLVELDVDVLRRHTGPAP